MCKEGEMLQRGTSRANYLRAGPFQLATNGSQSTACVGASSYRQTRPDRWGSELLVGTRHTFWSGPSAAFIAEPRLYQESGKSPIPQHQRENLMVPNTVPRKNGWICDAFSPGTTASGVGEQDHPTRVWASERSKRDQMSQKTWWPSEVFLSRSRM